MYLCRQAGGAGKRSHFCRRCGTNRQLCANAVLIRPARELSTQARAHILCRRAWQAAAWRPEIKIETIFPAWLEQGIVSAMKAAHPYEEVAYDILPLKKLIRHRCRNAGDLAAPVKDRIFYNSCKRFLGFR